MRTLIICCIFLCFLISFGGGSSSSPSSLTDYLQPRHLFDDSSSDHSILDHFHSFFKHLMRKKESLFRHLLNEKKRIIKCIKCRKPKLTLPTPCPDHDDERITETTDDPEMFKENSIPDSPSTKSTTSITVRPFKKSTTPLITTKPSPKSTTTSISESYYSRSTKTSIVTSPKFSLPTISLTSISPLVETGEAIDDESDLTTSSSDQGESESTDPDEKEFESSTTMQTSSVSTEKSSPQSIPNGSINNNISGNVDENELSSQLPSSSTSLIDATSQATTELPIVSVTYINLPTAVGGGSSLATNSSATNEANSNPFSSLFSIFQQQ